MGNPFMSQPHTMNGRVKRTALLALSLAALILSAGCLGSVAAQPDPSAPTSVAATLTAFLSATPTTTPPPSATPEPSATPTQTFTPSPSPTPTWAYSPAGEITAPILLYHHIAEYKNPNRYYVPPATFAEQMRWLYENGYTAITLTQLTDVIRRGGDLPARPVVITFDDGDADVYQNAFPIMRQYGFVGVFYLVANRMNGQDVVPNDALREMVAAGWEMGSHSNSHVDLTEDHDLLPVEVFGSKKALEDALGVAIQSFAYPFGAIDPSVANAVANAGYTSAVGLGISTRHGMNSLYYLSRMEVRAEYDLAEFAALLPWPDAAATPTP